MNSKSKIPRRPRKELRNAAISRETIDAIRGIQRALDEMKLGKGEPARKVLDRIRAKYKIPRRKSARCAERN